MGNGCGRSGSRQAPATIRLSSGRQDPQLVPARNALPISSTVVALPDPIASQMVASPTLKQAQTMGPAL